MKRHLQKNQYEMSPAEKDAVWQALPTPGPEVRDRRRPFSLPAAGVALATAAVACAMVLWTGPRVKDAVFVDPATEAPIGSLGRRADGPVSYDDALRVKSSSSTDAAGQAPPPPKIIEAAPDNESVAPPRTAPEKDETQYFQKYAIQSLDEDGSGQAGAVSRAGEVHERGGRRGETRMPVTEQVMDVPLPETVGTGSVTGGTTPPNGESAELMYFEHAGVNPFVATEEDALSTFAVDVDDASWSLTRSYLDRGALPPAAAVRVEEFVNAFDPGWPAHTDNDLRIHVDGAPSRFGGGYHLLRIGVTGRDLDKASRHAANLVFVVDVSGSMDRENRLGAVRHSLTMLLDELQEGDRVGIVVYGSRGDVRLEPTDIARRAVIQSAIDGLVPAGSTNAYEGLMLAYDLARTHYEADKINRLILCSDGVANNGATTVAEEMLAMVRRSEDEGISLSTIGFGMGNYNDVLMEKLANQGDGSYAYVDGREEAERVFRENLTGLLENIAREVKIQVEFDPERVSRWRLLGYENRDVADRDFRNDAVDAGEIGAGHRVTALYEVKLTDEGRDGDGDLGQVRLRWEAPRHDTARAGEITEIATPLPRAALAGSFGEAAHRLRLQAAVAEFAEILRGSYWARESSLEDLLAVVDGLAATAAGDGDAVEVARLVRAAARLQAEKEARARPDGR